MEDLATLEISRAQTWQWLRHGVTLKENEKVTSDLVCAVFAQEYEKIKIELKDLKVSEDILHQFEKAKEDSEKLFLEKDLRDFLSTQSDLVIH